MNTNRRGSNSPQHHHKLQINLAAREFSRRHAFHAERVLSLKDKVD